MAIKIRTASHAENPLLCNILTVLMWISLAACVAVFSKNGDSLRDFVICIVITMVAIPSCKAVSGMVGARISTKKSSAKPENLRKFCDQSWQWVVHVAMTLFEVYLLARPGLDWKWWNDPGAPDSVWEPVDQAKDSMLNLFYITQMAIWFYTAISHRYLDARHKDYFVMYAHHISTIILVAGSWFMGCLRIGLLFLFIHDASDIIVDSLKLCNYMGWDGDAGLYLTETMFVTNLVTWLYFRLWKFPFHVIASVLSHRLQFCALPGGGIDAVKDAGTYYLCFFAFVLQAMHVWWFYLFLRMAYRLIAVQEDAHTAAREEYEGSSDGSDDENEKDD